MENTYIFENVHHALVWSTETVRRASRPAISSIYEKGLIAELENAETHKEWTGWRTHLPVEKEERFMLAAKVWQSVKSLSKEQEKIIRLTYFGDWHHDIHLMKMLELQERMRKEGKRLRLNYRYSVRQVATLMDMNYRTVHRKLDAAMTLLEKELDQVGLLEDTHVVDKVG